MCEAVFQEEGVLEEVRWAPEDKNIPGTFLDKNNKMPGTLRSCTAASTLLTLPCAPVSSAPEAHRWQHT